MTSLQRFVPATNTASLSSDAPGYNHGNNASNSNDNNGPTCYKCKGFGVIFYRNGQKCRNPTQFLLLNDKSIENKDRDKPKYELTEKGCKVCKEKGYLPHKKREADCSQMLGQITRGRKCNSNFYHHGPLPAARDQLNLSKSNNPSEINYEQLHRALLLVNKAEDPDYIAKLTRNEEIEVDDETLSFCNTIKWLPRKGEQLCNLVGRWRILQHRGGHRWTTDDLVTAYVAGSLSVELMKTTTSEHYLHLDLGCGNASVLQMVAWCFSRHSDGQKWRSIGIEAREQAVNLARRSISYNISKHVYVQRGDFRQLLDEKKRCELLSDICLDISDGFDLITGTPPYFRVDFLVSEDSDPKHSHVTKAVINEGGMPSCLQSAPARCEFRGGIEAYCEAASAMLKESGKFVVCENWINNDRVYKAAERSSLFVCSVLPILGREGKNTPLFAVYTMVKHSVAKAKSETISLTPIAVRSKTGKHTTHYSKIMDFMSIPCNI